MSEGLRVEDVRKALERSWPVRDDNLSLVDRVLFMEVARAWLASQEPNMSLQVFTEIGRSGPKGDKPWGNTRPVTTADLVAALIAEGGEEVMVEFDMKTRCYVVTGAALNDGVHLVFPIPVESAEAKETP